MMTIVDVPTFASAIRHLPTDAKVVDVRTPGEYADGHVTGAINLDWLDQPVFKAGLDGLPRVGETYYVYCRSGHRSLQASEYMSRAGYTVVNLRGGYDDLVREGVSTSAGV